MRFLSQQPDANFVAFKCKPGGISRQFYSDKRRFGCNSLKHNNFEQQFRCSAGANTLSSMQLKASFFLLIFKVSISLMTIIKNIIQNLKINKELTGK